MDEFFKWKKNEVGFDYLLSLGPVSLRPKSTEKNDLRQNTMVKILYVVKSQKPKDTGA